MLTLARLPYGTPVLYVIWYSAVCQLSPAANNSADARLAIHPGVGVP